jgi:hypothetical protein
MNPKKTQIVKLSHGFTFLKARFALTDTGKVICGINPKSVRRMRRKLRTFRHWVDTGKMALCDAQTSYKAWRGSLKRYNSRKTAKQIGIRRRHPLCGRNITGQPTQPPVPFCILLAHMTSICTTST